MCAFLLGYASLDNKLDVLVLNVFSLYARIVNPRDRGTLDDGIPASQRITNKDYGQGGNGPTHTQAAKDDPEHHLNNLAGELAVVAVREVGTIMKGILEDSSEMTIEHLEDVLKNKYFKHPKDANWMEELITNWILKHPEEVVRAESKDQYEHTNRTIKDLYKEYSPNDKN